MRLVFIKNEKIQRGYRLKEKFFVAAAVFLLFHGKNHP